MKRALSIILCHLLASYAHGMDLYQNRDQLIAKIERAANDRDLASFKKALNLYALNSQSFLRDYHDNTSIIYQLAHHSTTRDDQQKIIAVVFGVTALIPLAGLSYWYENPYTPSAIASGIISTISLQLLYAHYYQINNQISHTKKRIAEDINEIVRKMTCPRKKRSLLQTQFLEQIVHHND